MEKGRLRLRKGSLLGHLGARALAALGGLLDRARAVGRRLVGGRLGLSLLLAKRLQKGLLLLLAAAHTLQLTLQLLLVSLGLHLLQLGPQVAGRALEGGRRIHALGGSQRSQPVKAHLVLLSHREGLDLLRSLRGLGGLRDRGEERRRGRVNLRGLLRGGAGRQVALAEALARQRAEAALLLLGCEALAANLLAVSRQLHLDSALLLLLRSRRLQELGAQLRQVQLVLLRDALQEQLVAVSNQRLNSADEGGHLSLLCRWFGSVCLCFDSTSHRGSTVGNTPNFLPGP